MVCNVLHVYNDFEPDRGGVARHIAGVAETVGQYGVCVRVAAKNTNSFANDDAYQVTKSGWLGILRHVLWARVVHVHGARKPYSVFAAALAAFLGRRIIYTPHCYYDEPCYNVKLLSKRLWDVTAERWMLRRSDAVILLSEYWRRYLASRNLSISNPVIIHNCVNGQNIERPRDAYGARLRGSPALLSVGRLDPVKRIDDAIRALTVPGMAGAILHIVGCGQDSSRLNELASKLGVSSRVLFYGFVDDAEVARMATSADVFVMPSGSEGMPTVLIEMLLMGVPVVASDIPGNRSILDLTSLNVLFPVGDVFRMAERILEVAKMAVSQSDMDSIREHFTWERTAHRIAALYLQQKKELP